jgi:hypothetical protein
MSFVFPVNAPSAAGEHGRNLVGSFEMGEVRVVDDRDHGTTLGIDDQRGACDRVPGFYVHRAPGLGLGAGENGDPARPVEVVDARHEAVVLDHDFLS